MRRRASAAAFPMLRILILLVALAAAPAMAAIDPALVARLATGDNDEKVEAIGRIVATGDPAALALFKSLADGEYRHEGQEVTINNRVRRELDAAMAAMRLASPDAAQRRQAARELASNADESALPIVRKALAVEREADIRETLELVAATLELQSPDKAKKLAAVKLLGTSNNPATKTLLLPLADKAQPDEDLRREAKDSLGRVEARLARAQFAGLVFTGVSLGSILLLAALGLAITYGLMGVINMAHGELIMIGAYTTYVVQNLFRAWLPGAFDAYLLLAVPASFAASMAVGMALERLVIRRLYGRPLETLLATWGISLILIQAVRTIFGAQNVQVENPSFMSGGTEILAGVVLPYSRIVIVGFAAAVLAGIGLLLTRTRLGLLWDPLESTCRHASLSIL